jgi:predicted acetyltransferase
MGEIIVRRVQGDELVRVMHQLTGYAFAASPPMADKAEWEESATLRHYATCLALFDDDEPMSCVVSIPMQQHVRGKIFSIGSVGEVAAAPEGRRKGYTTRLILDAFRTIYDAGQVFSVLYPFKESFYERLGYASFPHPRIVRFPVSALAPVLKFGLDGTFKRLPIEEGGEAFLVYLRKYQHHARAHGLALDDAGALLQKKLWLVQAQVNGETVGVMTYVFTGEFGMFTMEIKHFYYSNSHAKYLLLEWIARHIGQAGIAEIKLSPTEVPEMWLSDLDLRINSDVAIGHDGAMGRVMNVLAIGGMQTGPGRFCAHISDPQCSWNDGDYLFETVDGVLEVRPIDEVDCHLTIQAISALAYGTHDPADFSFRKWGNPSLETQQVMGQMFPRLLPYIHESF